MANRSAVKAAVPSMPSFTSAAFIRLRPRPGTRRSGCRPWMVASVPGQSAKCASPQYGVAPNSTMSPANSTRSCGSHTAVSPAVWLRPA